MNNLGTRSETFYYHSHGEINTKKTIELAKTRAEKLGINKIIIASETGLSALEAVKILDTQEVIVVSSAAGTMIKDTVVGDLKIGIPDKENRHKLMKNGVTIIQGTDPFWGLTAHSSLIDIGKLGMKFYEVFCSGFHVCITAILEATDSGVIESGEQVIVLAGSWVGLDTAIVAKACNTVDFFNKFEVLELICKPRESRYTWPISEKDWKGDLDKYKRFAI